MKKEAGLRKPNHICHDRQHLHAVSSTTIKLPKPRPGYLCYDNENVAVRGRRDQCGINRCKWDGSNNGHHERKPEYTYGQWHHTQAPKPRPDCFCYDNENIAWWGRRDQGGINCCKWEGAIKAHHKRKPEYTYGQKHHTQAPKTEARLLMLW